MVAWHLCRNLAECLPELSGARPVASGECEQVPRFWYGLYATALVRVLVLAWCEDLLLDAQQAMGLPPVPDLDFAWFGCEAEAAREAFAEFTDIFAGEDALYASAKEGAL
jgi:hypothetical protein